MRKKALEYNGKQYSSLRALSEACGVDQKLLSSRLRLGWSLDDAVNTGVGERNAVPVTYHGKEYPTMQALAEALDLNYDRLRSRIQTRNWSVEKAVDEELITGTPVKYQGETYSSIAALAQSCGIDYRLLQGRLQRGWSVEQSVQTEKVLLGAKPVSWKGQEYRSLKQLADELKLPETSLARAYSQSGSIGEAVDLSIENRRETKASLWGVEYPSVRGIAAAFGLNYQTLHSALSRGEVMEDAVKRILNTEPILFDGIKYACFSDLCGAYQIQPVNVHLRLKLGMPLEDALTLPIQASRNGKSICYRGQDYPSRIAMCREFGISVQCVYGQLRYIDTDFLQMFDVLAQLKECAGLPQNYQLNYIPACIFHREPVKTISQLAKKVGIETAKLYAHKAEHGFSNVFDALRSMKATLKPVYHIDGRTYTHSQLSERYSGFQIQRFESARTRIPVFPQLQGVDFESGCMDILELRRQLLSEHGLVEAPAQAGQQDSEPEQSMAFMSL